MKKLLIYFLSIISIVKIFFINSQKKNKKIVLFYFPVKIYQKNLIDLINSLKKNYKVILIYNLNSKKQIEKIPDSYCFDFFYAKFIPFHNFFLSKIDFFISSYISYVYPPNSKNIYISHDIYDAPMINQELEKNLFLRMSKLDYIFSSSELSKEYLQNKIKKVDKQSFTKIINTGYLKLDHLIKKIKKNKKTNSILIAPGYSLNYRDYNIYEYLKKIITNILNNTKKKIIFRPHPLDLTKKGNQLLINNIIEKFNKYKKFSCNLSPSYINVFNKSEILITDLTSTAYTFAFSTLKPVIFFSKNEASLLKNKNSKLKFFLDRKKIGGVITHVDKIVPQINYILKNKNIYKKKIKKLRKKRIEYFKISSKKTLNTLDNIFES